MRRTRIPPLYHLKHWIMTLDIIIFMDMARTWTFFGLSSSFVRSFSQTKTDMKNSLHFHSRISSDDRFSRRIHRNRDSARVQDPDGNSSWYSIIRLYIPVFLHICVCYSTIVNFLPLSFDARIGRLTRAAKKCK